jgi:hypothetical protein
MVRSAGGYFRQNVVAFLALFVALGGTGAYAANTVFSSDIVDGEVKSIDIGQNEIGSADVKDNTINTFDVHSFVGADVVDGTLEDQDVGQATLVNFVVNVGQMPPDGCNTVPLDGVFGPSVAAAGDHLLLTPSQEDAHFLIDYDIKYAPSGVAQILACNDSTATVEDGTTHFNLLVFDAN